MVEAGWLEDDLILPLEQLEGVGVEGKTREGIEDWRYWYLGDTGSFRRGSSFCFRPEARIPEQSLGDRRCFGVQGQDEGGAFGV